MRIFLINIILFLLFIQCFPCGLINLDLEKYDISKYKNNHFLGELGSIKMDCQIQSVKFKDNLVTITGHGFCSETQESFSCEVWIGKFNEQYGFKFYENSVKRVVKTTKEDGIFNLDFRLEKDDYLFVGALGYDPVYLKIYTFFKDNNLNINLIR